MSPSTNRILQLDSITSAYVRTFGGLSAEELNFKPDAKTWSVGQVIDHVMAVNTTYWPVVEALQKGTYQVAWTAKLPFLVRWFGDFILKGVLPENRKKVRTFPIWEPSQSSIEADIVKRFEAHQRQLASLMAACDALLAKGTVIASPANKYIVYTLDRAFDIIVAHERRHLVQAQEILQTFLRKK